MSGRRLVLLRHGRTAWNESGRAQGHADVPLDEVGHAQAESAAAYLASLRPAALWSSDLSRARQTCAYLEQETGLVAKHDDRLREFDVGQRQGMTIPEFAGRFPDEHAAWLRGDSMLRVPGAEVTEDVGRRIVPALHEALGSLDEGEAGIVVSHGAALKVGVVGLLGWPADHAVTLRGIGNCAWLTVEELSVGGRLRMVGYNESVRPGHDVPETREPVAPASRWADFASGSPVG
ncbi:MAG TPA: histidine phosphatase family protein [Marmoricola sp.]|nr:histidine phosphatase family protein [Marmoricola sp.]